MISYKKFITASIISLLFLSLSACSGTTKSVDPNPCANGSTASLICDPPYPEPTTNECQTSSVYIAGCDALKFCARVPNDSVCVKMCEETTSYSWCNESNGIFTGPTTGPAMGTTTCPTDGSFKYINIMTGETKEPVHNYDTLYEKLLFHMGGLIETLVAAGDKLLWSRGSTLYLGTSEQDAVSIELKETISSIAYTETVDKRAMALIGTYMGPVFVEIMDGKFLEPIRLSYFNQVGSIAATKLVGIKDPKTGETMPERDYFVFSASTGLWGVDAKMIKGGCIDYLGQVSSRWMLQGELLYTIEKKVSPNTFEARIRSYDIFNMSYGVVDETTFTDINPIGLKDGFIYGYDLNNKKIVRSLLGTYSWQDFLQILLPNSASNLTFLNDSMYLLMGYVEDCYLARLEGHEAKCVIKNDSDNYLFIAQHDDSLFGLPTLDSGFVLINTLDGKTSQIANYTMDLTNKESSPFKSLSRDIDQYAGDRFVISSVVAHMDEKNAIDGSFLIVSTRSGSAVIDSKIADLDLIFATEDPEKAHARIIDLKVSDDAKRVFVVLYELYTDKMKIQEYKLDNDELTEIVHIEPSSFKISMPFNKSRVVSPIVKKNNSEPNCAAPFYSTLIYLTDKLYQLNSCADGTMTFDNVTPFDINTISDIAVANNIAWILSPKNINSNYGCKLLTYDLVNKKPLKQISLDYMDSTILVSNSVGVLFFNSNDNAYNFAQPIINLNDPKNFSLSNKVFAIHDLSHAPEANKALVGNKLVISSYYGITAYLLDW